jgi:isopenicillin N synthase-like dioxygenase
VIDLAPDLAGERGALDRTAGKLRFALTEIGFYFIVNHGVPPEKIQAVFEQVKPFHEQPIERKIARKPADPVASPKFGGMLAFVL